MAGKRNPKRYLLKRLGKVGAASGYDLTTAAGRSDPQQSILPALWSLEASGHITRSPLDHQYRLTPKGNDTLMRIRKKAPAATTPTDINAERQRLAQEFHGPHWAAIEAVEDDQILSERHAIAVGNGMPPIDLSDVPKYRRAEVVDEALSAFRVATAGGPCSLCGTTQRRGSGLPVSIMDPQETPGFTPRADGTSACAWCANSLLTWSPDQLRDRVFSAIVGVKGVPIVGEYRAHRTITPFAHEIGVYSTTPWGHLTGDTQDAQVFRAAMRLRAAEVVHPARFCLTEGETSIEGIVSPAWSRDAIPKPQTKQFRPLSDAIRNAEEQKKMEERAAQAAYDRLHRYDNLNARRDAVHAQAEEAEEDQRRRAKALGVL